MTQELTDILGYLKRLDKVSDEQVEVLEKIKFEVDVLIETAKQEKVLREELELELYQQLRDDRELLNEQISMLIDSLSNDEIAKRLGYENELDYIKQNIKYFDRL